MNQAVVQVVGADADRAVGIRGLDEIAARAPDELLIRAVGTGHHRAVAQRVIGAAGGVAIGIGGTRAAQVGVVSRRAAAKDGGRLEGRRPGVADAG